MGAVERVLAEVRALRLLVVDRERERERERATNAPDLLGAVPYSRAAELLGTSVSELKLLVRTSVLLSVVYAPGKRPKIPLSEIRRLTTPTLPLEPMQRGRPSRRRRGQRIVTPEELDALVGQL